MKKTLHERYEARKQSEMLAEGFLDYFKKGSENIQTFNNTIAQLKNLSSKYGLKSLQAAVATAEKQFTDVVMTQQTGQKPDATKSKMISKATAFVSGMSSFMNTMKTITTQLPAMKDALAKSNGPEGEKTVNELLGDQAAQFSQLIASQLQKTGSGFLSKIKSFFTGSGAESPAQVMSEFGLTPEAFAQEIMNMPVKQMSQFVGESATVKPFNLAQPAQQKATNAQGTQAAAPTATTQSTQNTQASTNTAPTTSTPKGPANVRPTPAQAQERDVLVQHSVPQGTRNAYNTQMLGALSNEEIANSFNAIAKALGIKL